MKVVAVLLLCAAMAAADNEPITTLNRANPARVVNYGPTNGIFAPMGRYMAGPGVLGMTDIKKRVMEAHDNKDHVKADGMKEEVTYGKDDHRVGGKGTDITVNRVAPGYKFKATWEETTNKPVYIPNAKQYVAEVVKDKAYVAPVMDKPYAAPVKPYVAPDVEKIVDTPAFDTLSRNYAPAGHKPNYAPRPEAVHVSEERYSPEVSDVYSPEIADQFIPEIIDEYIPEIADEHIPGIDDEHIPGIVNEHVPDVGDESYEPEIEEVIIVDYPSNSISSEYDSSSSGRHYYDSHSSSYSDSNSHQRNRLNRIRWRGPQYHGRYFNNYWRFPAVSQRGWYGRQVRVPSVRQMFQNHRSTYMGGFMGNMRHQSIFNMGRHRYSQY